MSDQGKDERRDDQQAKPAAKILPPKKRKTEPEVTIAPSGPGGPDISVE